MITFKSKKLFYDKEKDGSKPNTIRTVEPTDARFDDLMEMIQSKEYTTIKIMLADNQEESFERQITDVSFYDEMFIISWKPNEFKTFNVVACHDANFKGIDCYEKEDDGEYYGFHSFYNGDRNNIDVRPGHAIWVKKEEAEQLYDIFLTNAENKFEDACNQDG